MDQNSFEDARRKVSQITLNGPESFESLNHGPDLPKFDRRMSTETQSRFDSGKQVVKKNINK